MSPLKNRNIHLWRTLQKENFTRIEELLDFLELDAELRASVLRQPRFVLNLPRRLAAKAQKNTLNDPILRQFLPLNDELLPTPGFVSQPVEDTRFQKTKKILHKYQGRALLLISSACAMHCRYCFRQNFPYETEQKGFEEEISYLKNDPTISEVILSGGDPLSLSNEALTHLFNELEAIPHIQRIRFHTRFPVGIPERIDDDFLSLLASSSKQIFFIVHINHSLELDIDVVSSLKKIQRLGIPVLNQAVLLKGVNDDEKILLALCESLINAGVTPYYLHALDSVSGAAHFALPDERGLELIAYLQKNLSGYGVPRFVREEPGRPSKTVVSNCK